MQKINSKLYSWAPWKEVEERAQQQLQESASLPFIYKHIAVMPDVHYGKGSTVGSVIPTQKAIIPAAVGVDIGCGMRAVKLNFEDKSVTLDMGEVRNMIEKLVPVGSNFFNSFTIPENALRFENALRLWHHHFGNYSFNFNKEIDLTRTIHQLGTLGGGNHFIELCFDQNDEWWIVLHSGSRGLGHFIASYYIKIAKDLCSINNKVLPHEDLAYLEKHYPEFDYYIEDMTMAQNYAAVNREIMMHNILRGLRDEYGPVTCEKTIECHHNYTTLETHDNKKIWVTRKGAINASEGQYGIIPGSMGTATYIVEGLGNPLSFNSCSHGAGRRLSRKAAKENYTTDDLIAQTMGVECKKTSGVLDEIPAAYKDIDKVMENQKDLVKIHYRLKQVVCVKG